MSVTLWLTLTFSQLFINQLPFKVLFLAHPGMRTQEPIGPRALREDRRQKGGMKDNFLRGELTIEDHPSEGVMNHGRHRGDWTTGGRHRGGIPSHGHHQGGWTTGGLR